MLKTKKIQALSLAKECYSMKLDLLTNTTVVDDAIRFVSGHSTNQKQQLLQKDPIIVEQKEETSVINNVDDDQQVTTKNQVF
jgi:hypothetical protein